MALDLAWASWTGPGWRVPWYCARTDYDLAPGPESYHFWDGRLANVVNDSPVGMGWTSAEQATASGNNGCAVC